MSKASPKLPVMYNMSIVKNSPVRSWGGLKCQKMSKFGSYACHLSKSQTVRLWMSSIISIANDRLQLTHPSTHPQVGDTHEVSHLQFLNMYFLAYMHVGIHHMPWHPHPWQSDSFVNHTVTVLLTVRFTKPPASQFPTVPGFDWYYSIVPPFCPWSYECGNGLWRSFLSAAFWEQPVTKEPAALWIALSASYRIACCQREQSPETAPIHSKWTFFCSTGIVTLKSHETAKNR